ncbi:unnamed protein product [Allacma fusca]|uniref:CRAL-TRIO domain-containing protein n=1 Tax=Allacma fusca TaxID=39272 RepID=A0A8J2K7C9_9HEXA|nr:unnamed protein product [Allacma fusca]
MEIIPVTEVHFQESQASNHNITEKLFKKLGTYVRNSPGFQKYSAQELRNLTIELESWEEPEELTKKFPYYFAGYDSNDWPVWIAEVGKFNIRRAVELGNEELLVKYTFKAIYRIIKTIHDKDSPEEEIRFGAFILDYDGFDWYQINHAETVNFMLRVLRDYKEVIEEFLGYCMLINVSHPAQVLINLVRPILGRMLERVDVFGTNKVKWIPALRRKFPENILPRWYGGNLTFKPIQVHG